ncbi:MAG: hypothetical protein U1D26_03430, partial [Patescibacteria group bacterium]|nr:hypothetical protein [Patescibacteria group bacterium]
MSIARVGVSCAVFLAGSTIAFAGVAHALGANVPTNQTTASTKQYTASKSPASCDDAKKRALGYPSDGEVTSINKEATSGILDSCISAVLMEGADMTSVDNYECFGRSGKVYIVTGTFFSSGSVDITTSPDKTLNAGECRISVCNGARGTAKVCKEPQIYQNGVSALSAGGIGNGPSPVVSIGAQPTIRDTEATLSAGSSIIGEAFKISTPTKTTEILKTDPTPALGSVPDVTIDSTFQRLGELPDGSAVRLGVGGVPPSAITPNMTVETGEVPPGQTATFSSTAAPDASGGTTAPTPSYRSAQDQGVAEGVAIRDTMADIGNARASAAEQGQAAVVARADELLNQMQTNNYSPALDEFVAYRAQLDPKYDELRSASDYLSTGVNDVRSAWNGVDENGQPLGILQRLGDGVLGGAKVLGGGLTDAFLGGSGQQSSNVALQALLNPDNRLDQPLNIKRNLRVTAAGMLLPVQAPSGAVSGFVKTFFGRGGVVARNAATDVVDNPIVNRAASDMLYNPLTKQWELPNEAGLIKLGSPVAPEASVPAAIKPAVVEATVPDSAMKLTGTARATLGNEWKPIVPAKSPEINLAAEAPKVNFSTDNVIPFSPRKPSVPTEPVVPVGESLAPPRQIAVG